jgi:hypothetical protein
VVKAAEGGNVLSGRMAFLSRKGERAKGRKGGRKKEEGFHEGHEEHEGSFVVGRILIRLNGMNSVLREATE